jgi:hypothetical protein
MVAPCLFSVYWLSVLAWWWMAERLRLGLSRRHPLLWASLGRTARPVGEGFGAELALLGFLLRRRDRFLDDRALTRLCVAMRVLLAGYVLLFVTLPALLLAS